MSPLDFALALRSLGAGAGLARRLRDALRGAGLSPKAAEGIAQALPKGGPYSRQRLREATPAEAGGLEELLRAADLDALEGIGKNRPRLALLLGEAMLAERGLLLPPGPPPAYPRGLAKDLFPERPALALLQGLPYPALARQALLLAEGLASREGKEGVYLGFLSQRGAGRHAALLRERWGEAAVARANAIPTLPEEARTWAEGPGRALLAPFAIGTVDMALRAVLPTPEAPLRLYLLSRKALALALPEDPRLFAALLALIQWRRALGSSTVIFSPLFSPRCLEEIFNAWGSAAEVPFPGGVALGQGEPRAFTLPGQKRTVALRAAPGRPPQAELYSTVREARERYQELAKKARLVREGGYPSHRILPDGRKLLLMHGRLPLGSRLLRENQQGLLVGSWVAGLEGGVGASALFAGAPPPWALKGALLEAEEIVLCPKEVSGRKKLYVRLLEGLLARRAFRLPEDAALLDGAGFPELKAAWERAYQAMRSFLGRPEDWPQGYLSEVELRKGPAAVFLLPAGEGVLEGAWAPEPLVRDWPLQRAPKEWLWVVNRRIDKEVGV